MGLYRGVGILGVWTIDHVGVDPKVLWTIYGYWNPRQISIRSTPKCLPRVNTPPRREAYVLLGGSEGLRQWVKTGPKL